MFPRGIGEYNHIRINEEAIKKTGIYNTNEFCLKYNAKIILGN